MTKRTHLLKLQTPASEGDFKRQLAEFGQNEPISDGNEPISDGNEPIFERNEPDFRSIKPITRPTLNREGRGRGVEEENERATRIQPRRSSFWPAFFFIAAVLARSGW